MGGLFSAFGDNENALTTEEQEILDDIIGWDFTQTSAGAPNSSMIPRLGSDGFLDSTLLAMVAAGGRGGLVVQDATINDPSVIVGTTVGQCWIVAAGAVGAWSGQSGKIAVYVPGNTWVFYTPIAMFLVGDKTSGVHLYYTGATWAYLVATADPLPNQGANGDAGDGPPYAGSAHRHPANPSTNGDDWGSVSAAKRWKVAMSRSSMAYVVVNTTPYTYTGAQGLVYLDTTGGAITVDLPSLATSDEVMVTFVNIGTNAVTLDANGGDLISGAATESIPTQYESRTLHAVASEDWFIV